MALVPGHCWLPGTAAVAQEAWGEQQGPSHQQAVPQGQDLLCMAQEPQWAAQGRNVLEEPR